MAKAKGMSYTKYTAEQIAALRQSYIDNECGSDEYRETQPAKGLGFIARGAELLADQDNYEKLYELTELAAKWLASRPNKTAYQGNELLEPVLALVFDAYWAAGENPYGLSEEDMDEDLAWQKEQEE